MNKHKGLFIVMFLIVSAGFTIVSCNKPSQNQTSRQFNPFNINDPSGLTVDRNSNVYFANNEFDIIELNNQGKLSVLVDTGCWAGCGGDGGLAISGSIVTAFGLCSDSLGNIYFTDVSCNKVHKINTAGYMSLLAGDGNVGYGGDGAQAIYATLNGPEGIAADKAGNIYIVDYGNNRIRKVNSATGVITTVAGNGTKGYSGDGGTALNCELNSPGAVTVDDSMNIYISDFGNHRIRKINNLTGIINTIAGNGQQQYNGDSLPALQEGLTPWFISFDSYENLYISDSSRICKLNTTTGYITTIAGNGTIGHSGDGGPAKSAEINGPAGIAVDKNGNIFFVDQGNWCVRKISAGTGTISTVAHN